MSADPGSPLPPMPYSNILGGVVNQGAANNIEYILPDNSVDYER